MVYPRRLTAVVAVLAFSWGATAGDQRVVIVSVDGLRPDVITPEVAPRMTELREQGTSASNAINDLPSATLPNHSTMLTGLLSGQHQVILNFVLPATIGVPTVFDRAHEAGFRSAFFASKTKLLHLAPAEAIETIDIDADTTGLVERMLAQLTFDGPELIFLHLRDPDSTGHQYGWLSPEYLAAVTLVDGLIGQVIDALDAEPDRSSYLILTADHGGDGVNHFINIPANRSIPWVVWGPDIAAGRVIDEVVSTADTMPTALWLLGLEIPAGLAGVPQFSVRESNAVDVQDSGQAPRPLGPPCVILVIPALLILAVFLRPMRTR